MKPVPTFALVAATLTVLVRAEQSPTPPPVPTFRAGTDVVELDVSVLDKNRNPVRGLTAADFTVRQDGVLQPIVAFAPIDVPGAVEPTAKWMKTAGADITSNDMNTQRFVVIFLDDARVGPRSVGLVRTTAKRVVDDLGPADEAAVVFNAYGTNQNFTNDHVALDKVIDSFQPHLFTVKCFPPPPGPGDVCTAPNLENIGTVLATAPAGRKILVKIGPPLPPPGWLQSLRLGPMGANGAVLDSSRDLEAAAIAALERANVSVYSLDPRGLETFAATAESRAPTAAPTSGSAPADDPFADATGGRTVSGTNTPWTGADDLFRENASYYLIGIAPPPQPADGHFHRIDVSINRPGVTVRTRSGYFDPRVPSASTPTEPIDSALQDAITRGLPTAGVPIHLQVAPFASPGSGDTTLVLIAGLDVEADALSTAPGPVKVTATAFDAGWAASWAARRSENISFTLDPSAAIAATNSGVDVPARLPLAPGRYEVRVAVEADGKTGSVFADVDVPNFTKGAVSLSGVLLSREPARLDASADELKDLVPVVPTAARTFRATDQVSAFARVYQGGNGRLVPVTVTMRIVNDDDAMVFEQPQTIDADRFGAGRAADYQVNVPLANLPAGEYLMTIDAGHRVSLAQDPRQRNPVSSLAHRDVRFSVH